MKKLLVVFVFFVVAITCTSCQIHLGYYEPDKYAIEHIYDDPNVPCEDIRRAPPYRGQVVVEW